MCGKIKGKIGCVFGIWTSQPGRVYTLTCGKLFNGTVVELQMLSGNGFFFLLFMKNFHVITK